MAVKTRWILFGVSTVLALGLVAAFTVQGATTAQISTSQKLYSVGANMAISGTGFTPGAYIYLTVQRPDQLTDSVLPQPFTDGTGAFTATYTPPLIPGRYTFTATDGTNTAVTAATEADAIGFNKAGYVKGAFTPEDQTGNWSSGDQGKFYLENQWTFDQFAISGISSTTDVPSFDVFFNHLDSSSQAIFIDALANFRACVDCGATDGASAGMLDDTHPLPPPGDTTGWQVLPVGSSGVIRHPNRPLNSAADGSGSTVLTGSTGFCSSDTKEATNTPAVFHCFHVDGPSLAALFATQLNSAGTHTLSLSYNGHLAASFVWNPTSGTTGNEGSLSDCSSPYYARPYTSSTGTEDSSFEPQTGNACNPTTGILIYGADDYAGWTAKFKGVGSATGSSRHWSMANQSSGPSGAVEIPIPSVTATPNTIIITKVTNPAVATGVTFPFTGTLGSFSLDTDPGTATPNTMTFTGIAPGVPYSVTEGASIPGGWTNTALNCSFTAGTDDGSGSLTTNLATSTAGITFGNTDSGVTATCKYTNTGAGHIIVQKHTTPSATGQSFAYSTTGTGYTTFSLPDGGSNTDGGTPPAGGLTPGTYTISENSVTGWDLTSRTCSITTTGSGTSTFPASGTTQPATIVLAAGDTVTCVYDNSKPDANVTITPLSPVNEVGNAETFTITATAIPNGASPVAFTSITPSVTPTAGLTTNTNTCATPNIVGNVATCTLTINSSTVGIYTAHVAAVVTIGGVVLNRATGDSNTGDSADGIKHYVDANITIGPATATNEVNASHTFNITVTALPDSTGTPTFGTVTATVTPTPSTLGTVSCSAPVGNVESCTLTINSTTAGTFTANACTTVTMGGVTVSRCTNDAKTGDVGPAIKNYVSTSTSLTLKSAPTSLEVGATATIVVTETNTGSGPLTNVNVTGTGSCASFSPASVTLAASASQDFTCTFTVVAGANAWSALGHGTDSLGNPAPSAGESQSGSVLGVSPGTSLTLKSAPTSIEAGSTVTIVVTETNTGNGPLTNVNVTGGGSCASFSPASVTLASLASQDFTCTFTAVAGPNAWSALGHGTDSLGNPAPSAGESQSGSVLGVSPGTSLTLKSAPTSIEAGSTVTIVVTETNTGNGPLTNVNVTGGGSCASFSPASVTLASLASQDFTCTFTAVAGPNAWSALGHGTDSLGNPAPSAGESQSGSVLGVSPGTSLTLKSAPTSIEAGSTVTIVVTETNTGNGPLTNVNVTGGGSCASFSPASVTLASLASQDFTCTFTAVAGPNAWSALGHGTDSLGNPAPSTNESQSGSVLGVSPGTSLTFVSQVPAGTVEAGTSVTITVNEKNTGNGTITGVSVTGSPCGTFTPPGGFSGSLASLASANFTCTFTAVVGTNSWSALGHGTDSLGNPVPTAGESTSGSFSGVLSTLIVVKHTVGGNGTFNYAGTGSGVPGTFTLITSGGTGSVTFAGIPSGGKSITETVPANWLGNTTNVSCSVIAAGVTPSFSGTLTSGEVAAGGTIAADVTLGVGATVECDFYNGLLPTLTIVKTIQGTGTATFTFPVTGDNTLSPTITPPPAPSTATYPPGPPTPPPGVDLNVGTNGTTSNNSISESGPPAGYTLTDFTCTGYTGGGTGAGALDSNGVPTSWNFIANFGNNVVCTFVNNNAQATRTQGFWATHTQLANDVWDGTNPTLGTVLPAGATPVIGSGDEVFGPGAGCTVAFTITAIPVKAENILMGGFWAGISKTSTKTKRTSIDQARMQMIQQYEAAVLNYHLFGSIGEGVLATARAAYCGTDQSAIQAQIGILGNLNQSGDTLGTTPGGSATTQTSKTQADIDAWDTPTHPVD